MAEKKEKQYVSDNAQLIIEWDWDKNIGMDPYAITWKSDKKAMWVCKECGHSWEAAIKNRSNGRGCPKCARIKQLATFNQSQIQSRGSLATENPDLAKQWHPTKNGDLTPYDVTSKSGKSVWWMCQHGHEWPSVNVLKQFESMLARNTLQEGVWQNFFDQNKWIFGYGLRYQILNITQSQPNYGGADISGRGYARGDYLTYTEGDAKFTCLVEIKRPNTELLKSKPYRNGAYAISDDLAGAIAQIQTNCAEWEINGSRTDQNRDALSGIHTISPKGIVIIGRTSELNNRQKRNSFERYRQSIHNPEIITFDELYERAKFIVGESIASKSDFFLDEDLPF